MSDSGPGSVAPGMLVGTSVRLKRLLGQGGMGSVWVAEHEALETEVAVKFISSEIAQKPEAVARFKREATAAAQLRSPHVVQIFDHGVTPRGTPYIVMELLEGEDLGKRIGRFGSLPVVEVVTVVTQSCRALGKAHARGIVHRDIKPDNIYLVDADGELFVKLLDFGIAKRSDDSALNMTTTGTMVGTPYFMSPEQVMSAKDADFRSDLWSLAVVAYNALSGRVPFFAETLGALCVAIHSGRHEPVTLGRPDLPETLDDWFQRALARDPSTRFGSAKEMAETFARAAGLPLAAAASTASSGATRAPPAVTAAINTPGFGTSSPMGTPVPIGTPAPMPTPKAPNTLLEATLTNGGAPKSHRAIALASAAAVALVIGIIGAGGVLLMRSKTHTPPEPTESPAASLPVVAEVQPSAKPEIAPAVEPQPSVEPPAAAAAPSSAKRAKDEPPPEPRRPRISKGSKPKPKPAASAAPVKAAPATTSTKKGKDYGF